MLSNINYTDDVSEKVQFVYLDNLCQEIFNFKMLNLFWDSCRHSWNKCFIILTGRIQNSMLQHVYASPLFHHDLRFLRLHNIHALKLLYFDYNCRHKKSAQSFNNFFVPVSAFLNHDTRQASKGDIFVQRFYTTCYGKRSDEYK